MTAKRLSPPTSTPLTADPYVQPFVAIYGGNAGLIMNGPLFVLRDLFPKVVVPGPTPSPTVTRSTVPVVLAPPPHGRIYHAAFPDFGGPEDRVRVSRIQPGANRRRAGVMLRVS